MRELLKTGDKFQVGIAAYTALSHETKQHRVVVRGRVTGVTKVVVVDTPYTLQEAKS